MRQGRSCSKSRDPTCGKNNMAISPSHHHIYRCVVNYPQLVATLMAFGESHIHHQPRKFRVRLNPWPKPHHCSEALTNWPPFLNPHKSSRCHTILPWDFSLGAPDADVAGDGACLTTAWGGGPSDPFGGELGANLPSGTTKIMVISWWFHGDSMVIYPLVLTNRLRTWKWPSRNSWRYPKKWWCSMVM